MDRIRDWMDANPDEGKDLRRKNRSFVFFQQTALTAQDECIGAQGIPLTAGRSLAVDKKIHVYGTPIWIDAELPILSEKPDTKFRRLMFAQDTGSAIVGPARADIYFRRRRGNRPHRRPRQTARTVRHAGAANGGGDRRDGAGSKDVPLPKPRPKDIVADATPTGSVGAAAPLPKPRP